MKDFFIKRKIEKYEQHLDEHLDDPVYFKKLGDLCLQLSRTEPAIEYYQDAIDAYYQDNSRVGEGNDFIFEICWKLLEIDPLNTLACGTLGQEYCGLGEFDEAITLYKTFASKLIEAAQYDDAIVYFRNALVLQPDDIEVRQNCFSLLWHLRRKEEAVQELRKIAELAEKTENITKALECYNKAVNIMPSDSELQTELKRLKQLAGNVEKPLRLVVNK